MPQPIEAKYGQAIDVTTEFVQPCIGDFDGKISGSEDRRLAPFLAACSASLHVYEVRIRVTDPCELYPHGCLRGRIYKKLASGERPSLRFDLNYDPDGSPVKAYTDAINRWADRVEH